MYDALLRIFAAFGAGCFLAGAVVASIAIWGYLELKKDNEKNALREAMNRQIDKIMQEMEVE